MDVELTNDSRILLRLLYKAYRDKLKGGASKGKADCFGGSDEIRQNIVPEWSAEDTVEICRQLHRAGLVKCEYADDKVYLLFLTDKGLIFMESRLIKIIRSILKILGGFLKIFILVVFIQWLVGFAVG